MCAGASRVARSHPECSDEEYRWACMKAGELMWTRAGGWNKRDEVG